MRAALFLGALFGGTAAVAAGCAVEEANMSSNASPTAQIPPARDGNIAIREELEAARRAGTLAAYDLFIARHPDHPLARTAREERERLAERLGRGR